MKDKSINISIEALDHICDGLSKLFANHCYESLGLMLKAQSSDDLYMYYGSAMNNVILADELGLLEPDTISEIKGELDDALLKKEKYENW